MKKFCDSFLLFSLLFSIFFFLNTSTVSATNIKWTGIANDGGLWSTPGNWSPAQVPVPGDSVTFDNTCTHCDVADVNTSAFITVAAGFTLHVTGSTWQSGKLDIKGSINFDGTSFTTTNDLIVRGGSVLGMSNATSFVVGGYFSNIGTIVFNTGNAGTMELDDTWEDDGGTLNLSGKNLILGGNGLNEIMCPGDFNTNTGVSSVVINKTQGSNSQVQVDGGCTLTVSNINSPALDENNSFISAYNGTLNVTGNVDAGEALIETFGSGTINISSTNWSGGSITVSSGGTIDASAAGTMTVKGYYGSFWGGGSGGNFYAPHTMSLVESSGGTPANFHGDTGIFYAGSGTLNVDGNFYGGANFNANTGTVNLTGVNQTINLDTIFYNLNKTVSSADTLNYFGSPALTVLGTLTFKGASGNNLTIQNLSAPTQWTIDAKGTRNLCYLSVRDSNNLNGTQITGFSLTDLHNNTGWDFVSTASCGGGISTPTIQFSSATGSGDETASPVNLNIELSVASASNITVDYTLGGTATGGGVDYTLANGTATILAGETSTTVPISIVNHSGSGSKTIVVTLSGPANADLGTNTTYTYTINYRDISVPSSTLEVTPSPVISNGPPVANSSANNDPSQPDAGSKNDPIWIPDYQNNLPLTELTTNERCKAFNNQPGWYGQYFDYPKTHPDMELPGNLWSKSYGDPLSSQNTWSTDWYDAKYFRFAKSSSNLIFGQHYFPFDYAPKEFTSGHDYFFGANWSSEVTALPGDYYFRMSSDDDSWMYVDGKLVIDNHGVHGATTKVGKVHLSGTHLIQIFFAERHTTDSHFYFAFDNTTSLVFIAHSPSCVEVSPKIEEAGVSNSNISTEVVANTDSGSNQIKTTPENQVNNSNPVLPINANTQNVSGTSGSNTETNSGIDVNTYSVGGIQTLAFKMFNLLDLSSTTREVVLSASAVTVVPMVALVSQGYTPTIVVSALTSFSEFQLWIMKFLQWLGLIFGLRRKRKFWGTVYDSDTKQPLDPAIVELFDVKTGKRVEEAITDMSGRFGFLAKEGDFIINARKTHFNFPSKNISGPNDQIYDNLYYGGTFHISVSDIITPNIPMDPLAFDWNQQDKQRIVKFHPLQEMMLNILFNSLFALGFVLNLGLVFVQPNLWHYLCLAFYIVVILVELFWSKQRLWGRVYNSKTKILLPGLLLELSLPNIKIVVAHAKTSAEGKFFLKAQPGEYILTVKRMNVDNSEILLSREIRVGENAVVNGDFNI